MARPSTRIHDGEDGPDAENRPPFIYSCPHSVSPFGGTLSAGGVVGVVLAVILLLVLLNLVYG